MVVYGYVNDVKYSGDGKMLVQVRVPNIHGPVDRSEYQGYQVRNYVRDQDLPYYDANLLPSIPASGDVVQLTSYNDNTTELIVSGISGGFYGSGWTNQFEDDSEED